MSFKLNEQALNALLVSEEGAVGRHIKSKAEDVVGQGQANVLRIMHGLPSAASDVAFDQEQTRAVVGVKQGGKASDYLARKAIPGLVKSKSEELWAEGWLKNALDKAFGK